MIKKLPSPNFDDRGGASPSFLILHYTGMESAQEALDRLCDKDSKVSAHYTVDEDGTVYQHVDEDKRAWHAGQSYWRGTRNLNHRSIGIEVVNPGHDHGYRSFTKPQIDALIDLCKDIMQRHDIEPENVLAHSDVAPDRKEDPGELFPWKRLADHGIGIWPAASDEDMVKGASINVYKALIDLGYDSKADEENVLIAFQRHFVPEAFQYGEVGEVDGRTKARLYALLANHLHKPSHS